jgi:glutamyl-tRNA synthetase
MQEQNWLSVRANIKSLGEVRQWFDMVHGDVRGDLTAEERAFVKDAAALLPPAPWDETTYDAWLAAVKPTTSRKGKELFMPIRKALTGMDHGPELKKLLPLIGREKCLSRLS